MYFMRVYQSAVRCRPARTERVVAALFFAAIVYIFQLHANPLRGPPMQPEESQMSQEESHHPMLAA
jgi:hypothetical protein